MTQDHAARRFEIEGHDLGYPTKFRDGASAAGLFVVNAAVANGYIGESGLRVAEIAPGDGISRCGGGTMPKSAIPSVTVDVRPTNLGVQALAQRLRDTTPPAIGYIAGDALRFDLRTVFPRQDEALCNAITTAFSGQYA